MRSVLPLVADGESSRERGDESILSRLRRDGEFIDKSCSRILLRMWSPDFEGKLAREADVGIRADGGLKDGRIAETWIVSLSVL